MIQQFSHRRLNILTGEWILVAPHRTKRPWQGHQEDETHKNGIGYDPSCYLCPGNTRANGEINPSYDSTYTFVNDFSALIHDVPEFEMDESSLLVAGTEKGMCKPSESFLTLITCRYLRTKVRSWDAAIRILTVRFGHSSQFRLNLQRSRSIS